MRRFQNRVVKHPKNSQRQTGISLCQGLCWKVHDHAQSFTLHSYTTYELCNQRVPIGLFFS